VTRAVILRKYLIVLSFLFSAAAPAWSAPNAAGAKEELQQLRTRIEALQKKLADAETSRNEAADALRESERAISEANRELAGLDQSSRVVTQRAQVLQGDARKTTELLENQQRALARLLHQQYVQQGGGTPAAPDVLRLALSGANPNDIARDLHYLGYVSRARSDAIRGMHESLAKLKSLSDETAARTRELAAIGAAQIEQRNRLEAERRKRAEVVARVSREIQTQRREIGTMRRNETRLTDLIEQLAKVVQRAPQAPREKPAPQAQREKLVPPAQRETAARNETVPQPTNMVQAFSRLRGQLALPVRGELAGRFGSPRSDGGLTWKGLFLAAGAGEAVKAVAAGRVVYADWLRGFGNLLIVDHGEGYMSLYGYNDALLKRVGDEINGGDTIARVGNSGGSEDSGLYFELRHQGKPFDPLGWVRRR
jgi:murein hydrolase activator